jgi:hypothetical protein
MSSVLHIIAFFKLYYNYCNGYGNTAKLIDTINKGNPKFVQFFHYMK